MIRFSSLTKAILLTTCLLTQQSMAQSAPAEQKVAQIKRVATSANLLIGSLSKNLFKTETYQAPYTVQVPYETTETYTVEVPYQVDETYNIEVPYQATETYTENVAYTVEIPYTEYITDYKQEYRCTDVTRYRQECRNEQRCYIVPGSGGQQCRMVEECGTNVHGQRICKTRQVCEDGAPQQRCDTQQVCHNVPYTDRDCRYEQVPYQREVTKYRTETRYRQETRTRTVTRYRTETRTRTVTKTRTETRTRTVTKYRDEQRCCETKTREVFDRQLQFQVEVNFPQEAQLLAGESEHLNINLISADATSATVDLSVMNSIYGYRIASQNVSGATIRVELALVPKFDLSNAGVSSIEALKIDWVNSAQAFQVSFTDIVKSAHVTTTYTLVISDLLTGATLEQTNVTALANGKFGALLTSVRDPQAKIKATISVKRAGVIVAGSEISFETSAAFEKRSVQSTDLINLADSKNVVVTLADRGINSALNIEDAANVFADVSTTYQIFLDLKIGGASKPLNEKTFTSEQVKAAGGTIKMADIIGYDLVIQNSLKAGNQIAFSVIVRRTSASSVFAGKTVKTQKTGTVILQ
ncbi:MAG: hypothetical protein ABL930_00970 [Pseudobdellovibrio sp.]